MYNCLVCTFTGETSEEVQNHMKRHRKLDLINAMSKLTDSYQNIDYFGIDDKALTCHDDCNNNSSTKKRYKINPRRSSRQKERLNSMDLSTDFVYCESSIESNYYMPTDSPVQSSSSSEDRQRVSDNVQVEPLFSTPKIKKEINSDTDSCSGNALSAPTDERFFCHFCGSGFRTEFLLSEHIQFKHVNYCSLCKINFEETRQYSEHLIEHTTRVYVCPYCQKEYHSDNVQVFHEHTEDHLKEATLNVVLSMENDYFSERSYMNTMYNMFNMGYKAGQRFGNHSINGESEIKTIEFYQTFLQHGVGDGTTVSDFGYLCRTCGFTLFDDTLYRDHLQTVHNIASTEIERFLDI